jgi:hypothetical protein
MGARNMFLNNFVNSFGANSSLSRELSMAPHTTICLGCNKSFRCISLHWNQKPVCCSSHQQRSVAACRPVLSYGRRSHDFGSDGSSSETGSSGSESCPSPMNLDENGLLGAVIFSHRNDAHMGVPLCCQWWQKECSIVKPSWQMDQSPTPESQQGS